MRQHIHKEQKEITLHMSLNEGVTDRDICRFTGISQRAMKWIRKTYCETGEVVNIPVTDGCPRLLDSLDANITPSTKEPLGGTWDSSLIVLSHSRNMSNATRTRPSLL
jgi:hypothetical protein